jgi:rubrerythrin
VTIIKEGSVSTDSQTNPVPFFSVDSIVRALRQSIVAELDAINMYQKMADSILLVKWDDEQKHELVRVIKEIADEEKAHVGEFQKLIAMLDKEEIKFYKKGVEEV